MALRTSREERKEYKVFNRYLDDPAAGLELITKLIAMPGVKEETAELLEKLNKLIHYDFITVSKLDNMPNEAEVYEKFIRTFEDLEDLTEFSTLANKTVVAIGGRFSSGKSKFLNSIIMEDLLPTDTCPTTSIPTYIISSDKEVIYALNSFNNKAVIDREAIKALCHATNSFIDKYNASFSHIIKIITIELPEFPFQNIAFLDTPGYSKSDTLIKGDNTDENIAREHLKTADQIIWLIDIMNGTISSSDLEFIKSLEFERPIFYVLNKADQIPKNRVNEIINKIKEDLNKYYLPYSGISAYSSSENNNNCIMGDDPSAFLKKVNEVVKHTHIRREFEKIFNEFISYNLKEQKEAIELKPHLEEIPITLAGVNIKNREKFDISIKKIRDNNIAMLKREDIAIREFETLKNKFLDIVDVILDKIKIKDEKKLDAGPLGILKTNERELAGINIDNIFEATVKKINGIFGISLKSEKFNDSIIVTPDEVVRFYNKQPKDIYAVNDKCLLRVIEIRYDTKEIRFSVIPI